MKMLFRAAAAIAFTIVMTSGGLADPSRCPVPDAVSDANYQLDQAVVKIQPNGTDVWCYYRTTNSNIPAGGLGFQAKCPLGRVLQFPGFILHAGEVLTLRALVATPLASGENVAEVIVSEPSPGGMKALTVYAYCS